MHARPTPPWTLEYAAPVPRSCPAFDWAMTAAGWLLVAYTVVLLLVVKAYYPQHLQRLLDLL